MDYETKLEDGRWVYGRMHFERFLRNVYGLTGRSVGGFERQISVGKILRKRLTVHPESRRRRDTMSSWETTTSIP